MPAVVSLSDLNTRGGSSGPGAFRNLLRNATAEAHARLDAHFDRIDLTLLPDYRGFLEVHAAVVMPIEVALVKADVARIFPDWAARSRTQALSGDLSRVRGVARPLPELPGLDLAGVLGTMYVLEGSRLGARVLLSKVLQSPDPVVVQATAYLRHGIGAHLWRSFLQTLERQASQLHDDRPAVTAARRVFELFEREAARLDGAAADGGSASAGR